LENTDDFITATEISSIVKERVFSDAKARGHVQTPKYGELFGLGDYVFVPSLERKVEDTEARLAGLIKEKQRLEDLEKAAVKASNEQAQRRADLEKRAVLAKIKAEQLKKERLAEAEKNKQREEAERQRKQSELARKKQETESKLAALKEDVAAKRMTMGDTTLQSLSPTATIKQMQEIDDKIQKIKTDYRKELANAIRMVSKQVNDKFKEAVNAKKDEFESQAEFERRVESIRRDAGREQTDSFVRISKKIEDAYNKELAPFIEELKRLSGKEFTILAQGLTLKLGQYNAKFNTYPVTIKAKEPMGGVLVACTANIPIPRQEARIFKQHSENNILRPEVSGNFQSTGFFRVAQAYVIDDATNKKYDLFSSKFVDLGNGIIYDSRTKLLWVKDGNYFKKEMSWYNAIKACERLTIAGLSGWRLPTKTEMMGLVDKYYKPTINPVFDCVSSGYWSSTTYASDTRRAWRVNFGSGGVDSNYGKSSNSDYVRAVRGGQ